MDIQLFLVIILAILTISLVVVCVYVIFILKEFRTTIHKMNSMIDGVSNFKDTMLSTSNILGMVGTVFETIRSVRSIRSIADWDEEEEE